MAESAPPKTNPSSPGCNTTGTDNGTRISLLGVVGTNSVWATVSGEDSIACGAKDGSKLGDVNLMIAANNPVPVKSALICPPIFVIVEVLDRLNRQPKNCCPHTVSPRDCPTEPNVADSRSPILLPLRQQPLPLHDGNPSGLRVGSEALDHLAESLVLGLPEADEGEAERVPSHPPHGRFVDQEGPIEPWRIDPELQHQPHLD